MSSIQQRSYSFQDLGLKEELLQAIEKNGIESPSEVQQRSIPYIIERNDVLVQAKSGLGKTLCFVLSILQMLQPNENQEGVQPQALILANTKELAVQISDEFKRFAINLPKIHIQSIIGGIPINQQIKQLKDEKPHIVVATLGRLADLLKRKEIDLSKVQYFVIDEADTILCQKDKEGKLNENKQLQEILTNMKQKHLQTMMFSATFTEESKKLATDKLNNSYKKIELSDDKLFLHGLKQTYMKLTEAEKLKQIVQILEQVQFSQCIIFTKNQDRAKALQKYLEKQQIACKGFYSGLTTIQRTELYNEFKKKQFRIIVSTDIFQRGVDFESLDLAIHFDMPINSDSYLHRSGRAGRFETKGIVISFVSSEQDAAILKEIQDRFLVQIEQQEIE